MRDARTTDEGFMGHPAAEIETVVADPDDVIEAFKRQYDEDSRLTTHVLRLTPPFDDEVRAELHVEDGPKRYPPEREPEPLHLSPGTFLENETGPHPGETHLTIPTHGDARRIACENQADDETADEETVESFRERLVDEWETEARDSLLGQVRIHIDHANGDEIWTDARYEDL